MSELEQVKSEVESLVQRGRITFAEGADRIAEAGKKAALAGVDHFGRTQAREVQKRPWMVPALAIVAVSEALLLLFAGVAWLVSR